MKIALSILVLAAVTDWAWSFGIVWECGNLAKDKFRCGGTDASVGCLYHTDMLCYRSGDPICENEADQWTGMCDNLCPTRKEENGTEQWISSFKCDDKCEEDFLKWCDGKTDCISGVDEAHCNCTANPTDCSLEWKERWTQGDYLEIILPIVAVVVIILLGALYGWCKGDDDE